MMPAAADDHRRKPRQRAGFSKTDVRRAIESARAGGLQIGRIEFRRDGFSLIPVDDRLPGSEADELERKMQEAFGEGGDD